MFGPIESSPYDVHFRLFGIPVQVHWSFWLAAVFFGWPHSETGQQAFARLLIAVACLFVSILIHEMGHALTARFFGWPPSVTLYWMGGLASYTPTWGHTTRKSVIVTFAGPCAGFLFYGLMVAFTRIPGMIHRIGDGGRLAIGYLEFINLWWGIVNLMPVYPLDGGQIARRLLMHWSPRHGLQVSLQISFLVGAGIAGWWYYEFRGLDYPTVLFGLLAIQSLQQLQGNRYY